MQLGGALAAVVALAIVGQVKGVVCARVFAPLRRSRGRRRRRRGGDAVSGELEREQAKRARELGAHVEVGQEGVSKIV